MSILKINTWFEIKNTLENLKKQEIELRNSILNEFFKIDEPGTQNINIDGVGKLKGVFGKTFKLTTGDNEAIFKICQKLNNLNLVEFKPELNVTEFNKLNENEKKEFDDYLTTSISQGRLEFINKP